MSIQVIEDLKQERARQDLSYSDLSDACGVSEATISKIFSGKADNPTIGTANDIAGALGLEIRAVHPSSDHTFHSESGQTEKLISRVLIEQSKVSVEKDKMIARLESGIQTRNRCIVVLFSAIIAFMTLLFAYLIFDIRNGGWGFIRYIRDSVSNLLPGLSVTGTSVL